MDTPYAPRRKLKKVMKKVNKLNSSTKVLSQKKLKAAINTSLNSTHNVRTLKINNHSLVRTLQNVKQELKVLKDERTYLLEENYQLRESINSLECMLGDTESYINEEIERKFQVRVGQLKKVIKSLNSHMSNFCVDMEQLAQICTNVNSPALESRQKSDSGEGYLQTDRCGLLKSSRRDISVVMEQSPTDLSQELQYDSSCVDIGETVKSNGSVLPQRVRRSMNPRQSGLGVLGNEYSEVEQMSKDNIHGDEEMSLDVDLGITDIDQPSSLCAHSDESDNDKSKDINKKVASHCKTNKWKKANITSPTMPKTKNLYIANEFALNNAYKQMTENTDKGKQCMSSEPNNDIGEYENTIHFVTDDMELTMPIGASIVADDSNKELETFRESLTVRSRRRTRVLSECSDEHNSSQSSEELIPDAVTMRKLKPGQFKYAVGRKDTDGCRKEAVLPRARSKSKKQIAELIEQLPQEPPKSIFDFHDKTPTFDAEKMNEALSVFSLAEESISSPLVPLKKDRVSSRPRKRSKSTAENESVMNQTEGLDMGSLLGQGVVYSESLKDSPSNTPKNITRASRSQSRRVTKNTKHSFTLNEDDPIVTNIEPLNKEENAAKFILLGEGMTYSEPLKGSPVKTPKISKRVSRSQTRRLTRSAGRSLKSIEDKPNKDQRRSVSDSRISNPDTEVNSYAQHKPRSRPHKPKNIEGLHQEKDIDGGKDFLFGDDVPVLIHENDIVLSDNANDKKRKTRSRKLKNEDVIGKEQDDEPNSDQQNKCYETSGDFLTSIQHVDESSVPHGLKDIDSDLPQSKNNDGKEDYLCSEDVPTFPTEEIASLDSAKDKRKNRSRKLKKQDVINKEKDELTKPNSEQQNKCDEALINFSTSIQHVDESSVPHSLKDIDDLVQEENNDGEEDYRCSNDVPTSMEEIVSLASAKDKRKNRSRKLKKQDVINKEKDELTKPNSKQQNKCDETSGDFVTSIEHVDEPSVPHSLKDIDDLVQEENNDGEEDYRCSNDVPTSTEEIVSLASAKDKRKNRSRKLKKQDVINKEKDELTKPNSEQQNKCEETSGDFLTSIQHVDESSVPHSLKDIDDLVQEENNDGEEDYHCSNDVQTSISTEVIVSLDSAKDKRKNRSRKLEKRDVNTKPDFEQQNKCDDVVCDLSTSVQHIDKSSVPQSKGSEPLESSRKSKSRKLNKKDKRESEKLCDEVAMEKGETSSEPEQRDFFTNDQCPAVDKKSQIELKLKDFGEARLQNPSLLSLKKKSRKRKCETDNGLSPKEKENNILPLESNTIESRPTDDFSQKDEIHVGLKNSKVSSLSLKKMKAMKDEIEDFATSLPSCEIKGKNKSSTTTSLNVLSSDFRTWPAQSGRQRRTKTVVSYTEPSAGKKLRRGDPFTSTLGQSLKIFKSPKFQGTKRKKSVLESLQNISAVDDVITE